MKKLINIRGTFIVTIIIFLCINATYAQVAVIVNNVNEQVEITADDLKEIFLGNKKTWSNGRSIEIVVQVPEITVTTTFYKTILGKTPLKMRKHWLKMVLSGKMVKQPLEVKSDSEVLKIVATDETAIGFVKLESIAGFQDKNKISILKINGNSPNDSSYILK